MKKRRKYWRVESRLSTKKYNSVICKRITLHKEAAPFGVASYF
ncbi:hypothetical protein DR864_27035 [Runella rosea]|uniref:Uncharacterized protein n=1 Tax=Runella rosea TaxID=2259595 RepID=A0A344TR60_9BACT|nr:hypothetical protein DR864_27035 [Runella rosea]